MFRGSSNANYVPGCSTSSSTISSSFNSFRIRARNPIPASEPSSSLIRNRFCVYVFGHPRVYIDSVRVNFAVAAAAATPRSLDSLCILLHTLLRRWHAPPLFMWWSIVVGPKQLLLLPAVVWKIKRESKICVELSDQKIMCLPAREIDFDSKCEYGIMCSSVSV